MEAQMLTNVNEMMNGEKIMNKLILSALLCTITLTSFGMFQQQMMPYEQNKPSIGLLLAGFGCVGLSMWYASREKKNSYNQEITITSQPNQVSGGIAPTHNTAYAINISPRAIGAIAPLIPAVFCFYYGFKNLNS